MNPAAGQREPPVGDRFLDLLGDPDRSAVDCSRVMAVFAHPDDEAIALGGSLSRLNGIRLMHVTDGAPANMTDAQANGFSRREDYAAARKRELVAAAAEASIPREALLTLGAADQTAAFRMPVLANLLSIAFRTSKTALAITHAYEGGHPDHDATAFIVHAACRLTTGSDRPVPEIVECPLYHMRDGQWFRQEFTPRSPPGARETVVELDTGAVDTKRRMLLAHHTQRRTLEPFEPVAERFRTAPEYDFSQLPNGGELVYEAFDWGVDGRMWLRLAQEARRELGLPRWF